MKDCIESRFTMHQNLIEKINKKLIVTKGQIKVVNKLVREQVKIIQLIARQIKDLQTRDVYLENKISGKNIILYDQEDNNSLGTYTDSENLIKISLCNYSLWKYLKTVRRTH